MRVLRTLTCLLEEVILDEDVPEGTYWLVGTLLELECFRGWAVSHLLNSAIMMACNLKLIHCGALLPCALATEFNQLLFDPSGSSVFVEALQALLEKAGEVATRIDTSLLKRRSLHQ